MAFEEEDRASSAPKPTPSRSPSMSLAQRVARIHAEVDALAAVLPQELEGAAALGVFELSDRMQAIAVRALPVVETNSPGP